MKWLFNMAKKIKRYFKDSLYLRKKRKERNVSENDNSSKSNIDEFVSSLISVDSMLCQSASIADLQFKDDSTKLLGIIKNHHVGVEVMLNKMDIEVFRSKSGDEFNPEIMQAHPKLINTESIEMHGRVATSVTPRFTKKQSGSIPDIILQLECVMLYKYIGEI